VARLHNISIWIGLEFIKYASRLGIPFIDMDKKELLQDVKQAHKAVKKVKI